nr:Gfo/Idh/MocA family oxidoreductase [bacterium]
MIRLAMLSYWHVHARGYAREFTQGGKAMITAVWDEIPERGREQAAIWGAPFYENLDDLLAREDIDAVCVTAPTNMHGEIMVKAAKAGKHIFTEKVMALTVEECRQIAEAVRENGVQFCISFPHRTQPHNLFAKKAVEQGWLGRISYMRVRNAHDGASSDWLPPHFYDATQCGGGAMMDLGAHPMYLCRWLMGKPVAISSTYTEMTGHGVEDNAVSVIEFGDGAIAVSETGFMTPNSPFMLEIYGTEGGLIITGDEVKINSRKLSGEVQGWTVVSDLPKALPSPINQFIAALEGEGEIAFGLEEGIQLTELMVGAYASLKEGKRVAL